MERIASVSCFLFFFFSFFPPFSLWMSAACSVRWNASRCKRGEQGSDKAQGMNRFRGGRCSVPVLLLCGLPQQLPPTEPFLHTRHVHMHTAHRGGV